MIEGILASLAIGSRSLAAPAASPADGGSPPQQLVARRGVAMRGLDMPLRKGDGSASGVSWRRGPRSDTSQASVCS
jgi:hypothetical protein